MVVGVPWCFLLYISDYKMRLFSQLMHPLVGRGSWAAGIVCRSS